MGLPLPLAEFILAEARYSPLPKRILLLGRQTVLFDDARMRKLLKKFGMDAGRFTPSST